MEDLVRSVSRYFYGRVEAEGGLSPSQFYVLKVLSCGRCTVSDLAGRLDMTAAGVTGMVDRLEKAGLVERTRDEADRRIVWVGLSTAGRAHLEEAWQIRRTILAEILTPLTPLEVEQLVMLYEKIALQLPAPGHDSAIKE
jgi:DNA-binding MarR family transcriptional regulator